MYDSHFSCNLLIEGELTYISQKKKKKTIAKNSCGKNAAPISVLQMHTDTLL